MLYTEPETGYIPTQSILTISILIGIVARLKTRLYTELAIKDGKFSTSKKTRASEH